MQISVTYSTTVTTITPLEGDGDQTAAIQAQIDAAPDGAVDAPTIIRFTEGRYHTEGDLANNPRGKNGVLHFTDRHNLIIEGPSPGNPAIFYTEAPAVPYATSVSGNTHSLRRHFWFRNCTNITVRNIRVEGSNYTPGDILAPGKPIFWQGPHDSGSFDLFPGYRASWEQEHAFDITDCQNMLIEDCQVDSVWGDGVYIGNTTANPSSGIVLRRLKLRYTGRQGVGMADCRNILLDGVVLDRGRRAAIDMEPFKSSGFVTDVEIKNCDLHCLGDQIAALGSGDVSRINIHDNIFRGDGGTLTCADSQGVKRRSDWTLAHNTRLGGYGSSQPVIKFTMTDNVIIDGNALPISAKQSRKCVTFINCGGALVVTNNNFTNGCYITSTSGAAVQSSGNTFGATCL